MRGRLLKNFFCLFSEDGRGGSQKPYGSLKNEQFNSKLVVCLMGLCKPDEFNFYKRVV
jgi:hypothetical protein